MTTQEKEELLERLRKQAIENQHVRAGIITVEEFVEKQLRVLGISI